MRRVGVDMYLDGMDWNGYVVAVVLCLVLGLVMEFCHLITILDFHAFGGTSSNVGGTV